MGNIKWSDELQKKTSRKRRRRRCCIACVSMAVGSVVATAAGLLIVWHMFGVTGPAIYVQLIIVQRGFHI